MNTQNSDHARDLTQAERQDCFGTTNMEELIIICLNENIKYSVSRNKRNLVIWRCNLTEERESILAEKELEGTVYVGNAFLTK